MSLLRTCPRCNQTMCSTLWYLSVHRQPKHAGECYPYVPTSSHPRVLSQEYAWLHNITVWWPETIRMSQERGDEFLLDVPDLPNLWVFPLRAVAECRRLFAEGKPYVARLCDGIRAYRIGLYSEHQGALGSNLGRQQYKTTIATGLDLGAGAIIEMPDPIEEPSGAGARYYASKETHYYKGHRGRLCSYTKLINECSPIGTCELCGHTGYVFNARWGSGVGDWRGVYDSGAWYYGGGFKSVLCTECWSAVREMLRTERSVRESRTIINNLTKEIRHEFRQKH